MFEGLATIYAASVIDGKRTLEQVPKTIREQVKEIIKNSKKEN